MSQVQGVSEIFPLFGEQPRIKLPLAASQSLIVNEPVYLNSGLVTRWLAVSGTGNTDAGFFGWIDQPTVKTLNGASVSLPAGTLISVIPAMKHMMWNLPSYGTAPVLATHLAAGANTTGFVVYNDAGVYKVNLSTATKAVVRPYSIARYDARSTSGSETWKSTFAVGDTMTCSVLDAAKQVVF